MDVQTIAAYLLGSRAAIERVAADPWAVWVGLALVASAGLARSYSSRDLGRQPWHLVLPGATAVVLSLALATALLGLLTLAGEAPPWAAGFRSVAGLVLLTSPLVYLYAIPYERFLPLPRAARARLLTLGVVAAWRVGLVVRAAAVLLDGRALAAVCVVLLVCDGVALAGVSVTSFREDGRKTTSTPILLGVMSGISPPDSRSPERLLLGNVTVAVAVAGVFTLPLWVYGCAKLDFSAQAWRGLLSSPQEWPAPQQGVWVFALLPAAAFLALLPWSQRAPRLRSRVEDLFRQGQVAEVLRLVSARTPGDFPPGWSPPPTEGFRDPPTLLDVVERAFGEPAADWVRQAYLGTFRFYLSAPLWYWYYDQDLERVAALLTRLPEGPSLARLVLESVRAFEGSPERDGFRLPDDGEEGRDGRLSLHLFPEPVSTGRRAEVVAAIERLAAPPPPPS